MIRVAILIDDFFPASGGIGRSVQTQLEELTALGHEVTLIVPDRHLEKPRIGRVIECPSHYLNGLPAHLNVLHHSALRAQLISRVAHFDVVHSQTERGAVVLAARLARLQGIPHVHTFHANIAGTHQTVREAVFGTLLYQWVINPVLASASGRRSPTTRMLPPELEPGGVAARIDWQALAGIACKVDAVTAPSRFMLDLIETAAGRPLDGHLVPTGYNRRIKAVIDATVRERSDSSTRFLSVGRLSKEKRLDVLIRAFQLAGVDDSELVIVGDGDQAATLKRLASLGGNIDFRGHVSALEHIAFEMRNADVLALTSYRFDNQPIVITEAVAAGLPILYCDDRLETGLSDATSLLTGPGVEELAEGIRRLCDPELRGRMSAATEGLIEQLSPQLTAERYVQVYQEAIAKGRAERG